MNDEPTIFGGPDMADLNDWEDTMEPELDVSARAVLCVYCGGTGQVAGRFAGPEGVRACAGCDGNGEVTIKSLKTVQTGRGPRYDVHLEACGGVTLCGSDLFRDLKGGFSRGGGVSGGNTVQEVCERCASVARSPRFADLPIRGLQDAVAAFEAIR